MKSFRTEKAMFEAIEALETLYSECKEEIITSKSKHEKECLEVLAVRAMDSKLALIKTNL